MEIHEHQDFGLVSEKAAFKRDFLTLAAMERHGRGGGKLHFKIPNNNRKHSGRFAFVGL